MDSNSGKRGCKSFPTSSRGFMCNTVPPSAIIQLGSDFNLLFIFFFFFQFVGAFALCLALD